MQSFDIDIYRTIQFYFTIYFLVTYVEIKYNNMEKFGNFSLHFYEGDLFIRIQYLVEPYTI